MQKYFDPIKLPPISMWEKELAIKLAEKDSLYREYYKPKDDTAKVEKNQRSIKEILYSESMERTARKSRDMELQPSIA